MESIYKYECPECGEVNFVNNGDEEDLTTDDVYGVECHSCSHKWIRDWDELGDLEKEHWFCSLDEQEALENCRTEKGLRKEDL